MFFFTASIKTVKIQLLLLLENNRKKLIIIYYKRKLVSKCIVFLQLSSEHYSWEKII